MNLGLLLITLSYFFNFSGAAYCSGSPDSGERESTTPIYDEELRFIRSVKNGMLFEAGPPNASFPVVHLWGNAYEMGFAQGSLMKEYIKGFVYKTWGYLITELKPSGDMFSDFAKDLILKKGMSRALQWTADVTAPFTPQDYYDEVKGLADASGISYDILYQ